MNTSLRYSRSITLPGWGSDGQQRLGEARVLLVGVGGLGVPAATYLAAAGTGRLVLNDFDSVDESNLARQPLYATADIGKNKAKVAAARLTETNPDCTVEAITKRLDAGQLRAAAADCDVVLDCSDNFATRFAVNQASLETGTPLVSGAAIRFEAQLAVFRFDLQRSPCYRCLYDEAGEELEDCRGQGVVPALVGAVGAAMALEAMRIIVGFGAAVHSKLLVIDALHATGRSVSLPADPACPACQNLD
ncbi:MAG: HesA/MoeB/ThiF family protein [Gammaproteobacteria bacterium]|nr:HesA/MoeB/ThiF family protein [Gammaproteobacteria bacterium]NNF61817.1 HesA/MoeB/ThiF family protein [Gammaproteobacteria bacterium]NNM19741.1 HesA/MoeB/ThiF family protein [Gammaproteobacteria bacterium]